MTNENSRQSRKSFWRNINATRVIVATLGVLIGISGMNHGFFETLQGSIPTGGLIIQAIGKGNNWTLWTQGGEEAFTLVPNFLITGILAIIVGLMIISWSVGFVHRKNGSLIFLLLCILLFLVGGGIGQIVFFTLAWAISTRINTPLTWWRTVLPKSIRGVLAKCWLWTLVVSSLLFMVALELAIFGFLPGVNAPDLVLHICWSILGFVLGLLLLTFVSGFAHDIERQAAAGQSPLPANRHLPY